MQPPGWHSLLWLVHPPYLRTVCEPRACVSSSMVCKRIHPVADRGCLCFAAAWLACLYLCTHTVVVDAQSLTHHRHNLQTSTSSSVATDTGCGYSGSKVLFTALYGTTVRTHWLNCAIESAMLKQGNDSVVVLTDDVEQFDSAWPKDLPSPAQEVNVVSCLANTPLQHWFDSHELASAVFRQQNIANALRLAAIYKNGGAYLDLDIVPISKKVFSAEGALSMQCTKEECGDEFWLNNAYLNFPPKHPFMWQLMNAFALEFNGNVWGYNGPRLVSTLYNRLLCGDPVAQRSECEGAALLPVERLAPLSWSNTIEVLSSEPSRHLFEPHEGVWAVHVYHNMWKEGCIPQPSVFSELMAEHCPQVSVYSSNNIYCQVLM